MIDIISTLEDQEILNDSVTLSQILSIIVCHMRMGREGVSIEQKWLHGATILLQHLSRTLPLHSLIRYLMAILEALNAADSFDVSSPDDPDRFEELRDCVSSGCIFRIQ